MLLSEMLAELGPTAYWHERLHGGETWSPVSVEPQGRFVVVAWDCNDRFGEIQNALKAVETAMASRSLVLDRVRSALTSFFVTSCCTAHNESGADDSWIFSNRCLRHT